MKDGLGCRVVFKESSQRAEQVGASGFGRPAPGGVMLDERASHVRRVGKVGEGSGSEGTRKVHKSIAMCRVFRCKKARFPGHWHHHHRNTRRRLLPDSWPIMS